MPAGAVAQEAERLFSNLLHVECQPGAQWTLERCYEVAPLTAEINRLKARKNAIILAHSYVNPEIVYGVADFKSDSYALSLEARDSAAEVIVFAGVVFMAETAKILCPDALVVVPDIASGCSLADSLTGAELLALKARYPEAAVVCYINSSAEVKAASDVCVTSGNVYSIIDAAAARDPVRSRPPDGRQHPPRDGRARQRQGDPRLGRHLPGARSVHGRGDRRGARPLPRRQGGEPPGVPHRRYRGQRLRGQYRQDDGIRARHRRGVLHAAHRVRAGEPGGGGESRQAVHRFLPAVSLHEAHSLKKIRDVLVDPQPHQIIELDETVRAAALRSLERMFELTP